MNEEKRGPGRPPLKAKEDELEPMVEVQGNTVAAPQTTVVEKVIAATGDERSIAATLDASSGQAWTAKSIKQVVQSVDPMTFVEPQKVVLDEVKAAHPDFNVKYRYISDDKIRVSQATYLEYWKPVNRTSHPRIPADLINDIGCVECMGQILMFRPVEIDTAFVMKPRIQHQEKLKDLEEKADFDDRFYRPTSGEVKGKAFFQNEDLDNKDFVHDFVDET